MGSERVVESECRQQSIVLGMGSNEEPDYFVIALSHANRAIRIANAYGP